MTIEAKTNKKALAALKKLSLIRTRVERFQAFYEMKTILGYFDAPVDEEDYWHEEQEELEAFWRKAHSF